MSSSDTPNSLRIILSLFTAVSFRPSAVPHLVQTRKHQRLARLYVAESDRRHRTVYNLSALCISSLSRLGLVWLLFLALFTLTIKYAKTTKPAFMRASIILYSLYFTLSLLPIFLDLTTSIFNESRTEAAVLAHDIFMGVHMLGVHPTVLIPTIFSIAFQLWTVFKNPSPGLSLLGLAIQVVVFALVAVSWQGCMVVPDSWTEKPDDDDDADTVTFLEWYKNVG
ncbi:hypothetical protein BJY01DRAFT_248256 [Aspergillus pseudoustus]|uniref:Uncharacterized protein n=1 Tax=Aspergillus pseudoustus TaxID=1810923 RepID=A0ABR4JVQ6_9EURO